MARIRKWFIHRAGQSRSDYDERSNYRDSGFQVYVSNADSNGDLYTNSDAYPDKYSNLNTDEYGNADPLGNVDTAAGHKHAYIHADRHANRHANIALEITCGF
jgi:hypothetical protein